MKIFPLVFLFSNALVCILVACTAHGDPVYSEPITEEGGDGTYTKKSSDSKGVDSSSSESQTDSTQDTTRTLSSFQIMVDVSTFFIGETEVTQGLYREVMGKLPKDNSQGDNYPVFNVSWYDAVLFCNALSKEVGLDTAYVYDSVAADGSLDNLSVDYNVESVRLPTEMEWEKAVRGGTSSTYYWGTDVASKYAYYAQSNGPVEVAGYAPNVYGLYDMGGNVAEWTNDWSGTYPADLQENYTGAESGKYKVVRGGGWSDKVTALASSERDKKDPLYVSQTIGFRIVHSKGL